MKSSPKMYFVWNLAICGVDIQAYAAQPSLTLMVNQGNSFPCLTCDKQSSIATHSSTQLLPNWNIGIYVFYMCHPLCVHVFMCLITNFWKHQSVSAEQNSQRQLNYNNLRKRQVDEEANNISLSMAKVTLGVFSMPQNLHVHQWEKLMGASAFLATVGQ